MVLSEVKLPTIQAEATIPFPTQRSDSKDTVKQAMQDLIRPIRTVIIMSPDLSAAIIK